MIIDAHQHFWKRDLPFDYQWLKADGNEAINRDYLPEDLKPRLERAGVTHSIFVQTQHNLEENRWALSLAEQNEFLVGVVGWVDLASPNCGQELDEFLEHPKFVGIRHITQDEPNDDFILRPDIIMGLATLQQHAVPFDLLFYAKHLKHAATVADQVPDLPLVIDHLSKPGIKAGLHAEWAEQLKQAAERPNVYCKLSGLVTEADWGSWCVDDLRPYVETALECFGSQRIMFGSDWPVCELAASYGQVYDAARELLKALSASEQQAIFCDNAKRFYQLDLAE